MNIEAGLAGEEARQTLRMVEAALAGFQEPGPWPEIVNTAIAMRRAAEHAEHLETLVATTKDPTLLAVALDRAIAAYHRPTSMIITADHLSEDDRQALQELYQQQPGRSTGHVYMPGPAILGDMAATRLVNNTVDGARIPDTYDLDLDPQPGRSVFVVDASEESDHGTDDEPFVWDRADDLADPFGK